MLITTSPSPSDDDPTTMDGYNYANNNPGRHANGSIRSESASSRLKTVPRAKLNRIGNKYGCHSCGAKSSGRKNWIADHQPPTGIARGRAQRLYPHCKKCSAKQGAQVKSYKKYKLRR